MPCFNFQIPQDFAQSLRLDKYVSENLENMNRSKLKTGISELQINGKPAKLSSKVKAGDKVSFNWQDNIPENIEGEEIPLNINP